MFEGVNYFNSRPELYILQAVKDNPAAFEGAEGVTPEMLEKISGFNNKLFGIIDLGAIPKTIFDEGTVWNAAAIGLLLIPIISGVIQLAMTIYSTAKQKKLNPEASAQMGSMNMILCMDRILLSRRYRFLLDMLLSRWSYPDVRSQQDIYSRVCCKAG